MSERWKKDLDEHLERFERRLPNWAARIIRWVRQPSSRWVRIPLGVVLVLAGIVGFLPILGFWMVPLGLLLLAHDIPFMQPPLVRLLDWVERKWPEKRA
jgi:hypothetical protein